MGTTYRFLAVGDESNLVTDWFRTLPEPPTESPRKHGVLFCFRQFGPLTADSKTSPLVNVFLPVRKRGVLSTAGEVHFLATPLSQFPELAKINRCFRKWISQYVLVHSMSRKHDHAYDYYLEGSLKNWDSDIFALPQGLVSLQAGSYFVSGEDTEWPLEKLCRQLKLRGVTGVEDA